MDVILRITVGLSYDKSIQEYQVHEYEPKTRASLNSLSAEIRINIETTDQFIHMAGSFFWSKDDFWKNDDTAYANADLGYILCKQW